jgi:LysR family transcriptional regulator (chromosome initiation inhibitor)
MKIDPRRSEAFMAAVDGGSLEAAASRLRITPSAVSQRIAALEQEMGAPLLVRTRPSPADRSGHAPAAVPAPVRAA